MKLKNKISGEIKEFALFDGNELQGGATLESLTKEWEDYEEPKESEHYWYIGYKNDIRRTKYHHISDFADNQVTATRKEIGNCFESLEEAEKALEKLKAWHKLMDYWGTEVLGWEIRDMPTGGNWQTVNVKFNVKTKKEPMELLDIVFGGEE